MSDNAKASGIQPKLFFYCSIIHRSAASLVLVHIHTVQSNACVHCAHTAAAAEELGREMRWRKGGGLRLVKKLADTHTAYRPTRTPGSKKGLVSGMLACVLVIAYTKIVASSLTHSQDRPRGNSSLARDQGCTYNQHSGSGIPSGRCQQLYKKRALRYRLGSSISCSFVQIFLRHLSLSVRMQEVESWTTTQRHAHPHTSRQPLRLSSREACRTKFAANTTAHALCKKQPRQCSRVSDICDPNHECVATLS